MKKLLAILLVLATLISLVGCGAEKAPEGYMSVSRKDEIFNLYVPKSWKDNSKSGVSGASLESDGLVVSASTQAVEGRDLPLSEYVTLVTSNYEKTLLGFAMDSEPKETVLGSFPAISFTYTATSEKKTVKFQCVIVKTKGAFTTVTCCAPEESFAKFAGEFEGILSVFTFRDAAGSEEDLFVFEDENTPDGFQLASGSEYEFRFYVPKTWKVDTKADIPTAVYSTSDFSNVTLNSFAVSGQIKNGEEYWNAFKENYEYDIVEGNIMDKLRMGGYPAMSVEYVTHIGGNEYHVRQVFINTYSMIYIMTYTSDAERYDTHMRDVDRMIQAFEFKK